jgi:hypothetical protein
MTPAFLFGQTFFILRCCAKSFVVCALVHTTNAVLCHSWTTWVTYMAASNSALPLRRARTAGV